MFAPLYIKTNNSLLSSMIKIDELITFAKENNIKALTITDPNMYGTVEFYKACKASNIKPIIGLEITSLNIIVYAKNNNGYKNIVKLCTIQSERELLPDDFKDYGKDIIVIAPFISLNIVKLLKEYCDDIYLSYSNENEHKRLKLHKKVYMNKILYLTEKDSSYINYLYGIRDGLTIDKVTNKIRNNFIVTEEEIDALYPDSNEINKEIIDKCNVEIGYTKGLLPKYDCPDNLDSYTYLKHKCKDGLKRIFGSKVPRIYLERLKFELETINQMNFCDYFLVVSDFINYAKENNIYIGPGRGSAAGSLVSYLLNIITIDPIKYNLLFERFLNPERITMPDIDVDVEDCKRDELIRYCMDKYGKKKVVPIIAFGTLKSKQAIRDVARVMNINLTVVDFISKQIDASKSLKYNIDNNIKLRDYIKMDEELISLYKIAMKFENLKRHTTIHAAGVIMSSVDIDTIVPLDKSHKTFYTTSFDMNYLEELGLLKMDFLALSNLNLVHNMIDDIEEFNTMDDIPDNDKKALQIFHNVDVKGIFQFESEGMINFLKKFKPSTFEDVFAAVALYRPGPMQFIDSYIARKYGKEKIDYIHPNLEKILKPTYGIIIYQEQIMQIARIMAGYSLGEADVLRRAMSKKKESVLIKEKEKFISQSINLGYDMKTATRVYEMILKFASYGFNRSHSVAYANLSYKMAYLKANYPLIFMKNLLNNFVGTSSKVSDYLYECKNKNINITLPNVNISDINFTVKDNSLIYPIMGISGVGKSACEYIINERKNMQFEDIYDFFKRCYNKSVNKKTMESLIKAGCLGIFGYNKCTLINNLDDLVNYSEISSGFDSPEFDLKPVLTDFEEYNSKYLSFLELEAYGFYITNHPVSKYRINSDVILKDITKYTNKNINVVVMVDRFNEITTKKGDKMVFMTCSDEYSKEEFVIFPTTYKDMEKLLEGELIKVNAKVEFRNDKYQLIVNNLTKID